MRRKIETYFPLNAFITLIDRKMLHLKKKKKIMTEKGQGFVW